MFDYQHAVFYEVWPRSFQDSNDDGIGDLQGVIQRIPYLSWLGIDALWLGPIYKSPNDDYGYDIEDYYQIQPEFGTMDDLKQLIKVAKEHNIAIILDLVANHTSTKHAFFQKALNNPNSPYRDYYFFRKGTKTTPPNNWLSFFGTSAWQKAEDDMWYLTLYSNTQADLNWENPKVREEIKKVMNFYLDLGVDGFRMDTINTIDKKEGLPSIPTKSRKLQFPGPYVIDGPKVKTYLQELRNDVLIPHDAFALGEGVMVDVDSCIKYCSGENAPLDMMFQFDLVTLGYGELGKYDPRKLYRIRPKDIKNVISKWQNAVNTHSFLLGNYISNHDHKRPLDRFGDVKEYRIESSKMLAMLNFVIQGVPFIYQGEEIGMTNPKLTKKDWKDYEAFHASKAMTSILYIPPFIAEKISSFVSRDNARTPMQWSNDTFAGFSNTNPWIKLVGDHDCINVESEKKDPYSILHFYRKLIELRHKTKCFTDGTYEERLIDNPNVFACYRTSDEDQAIIIINLTNAQQAIEVSDETMTSLVGVKSLLTNYRPILLQQDLMLDPYESHIFYTHKKED